MKLYRIIATLIVLILVALMAISQIGGSDSATEATPPAGYDDAAMKDLKL